MSAHFWYLGVGSLSYKGDEILTYNAGESDYETEQLCLIIERSGSG